jgi:hypothetical protein
MSGGLILGVRMLIVVVGGGWRVVGGSLGLGWIRISPARKPTLNLDGWQNVIDI